MSYHYTSEDEYIPLDDAAFEALGNISDVASEDEIEINYNGEYGRATSYNQMIEDKKRAKKKALANSTYNRDDFTSDKWMIEYYREIREKEQGSSKKHKKPKVHTTMHTTKNVSKKFKSNIEDNEEKKVSKKEDTDIPEDDPLNYISCSNPDDFPDIPDTVESSYNHPYATIYRLYYPNKKELEKYEYIGSTIQTLQNRLELHKASIRQTSNLYKAMRKYGRAGLRIEKIEVFPCNTHKELRHREDYWINKRRKTHILWNMRTAVGGKPLPPLEDASSPSSKPHYNDPNIKEVMKINDAIREKCRVKC